MVKKLAFLFILFGISSCFLTEREEKVTDADVFMYADYTSYLKITSLGQKAVTNAFAGDINITYFYRDFPEQGVKFLIFYNKKLNQQYAIFYGYSLEKRKVLYQNAKGVSGLNIKGVEFNQEVLKIFLKIEEYIEPRFEKGIKKILIGSEVGGAIANMMAASLVENSGTKSKEIEVVTFGSLPFSSGFNTKFTRTNVVLEGDPVYFLKTKCCNQIEARRLYLKMPKVKSSNILENYHEALKESYVLY
jgi:hypothetical protein